MLVTKKTRLQNRIQNIIFYVFFLILIGLLAWLSTRYTFQSDWSASNRNSLSDASQSLLEIVDGELKITSYTNKNELIRRQTQSLINQFQRYKNNIEFSFINPESEPELTRQHGITVNGEIIIEYKNRRENIREISEQALTNAIQRVVRDNQRWIVFLEGHGERSPHRQANHDVQAWASQLNKKGFKLQTLNLADNPQIPDNTSVLVLASPQVELLAGEIDIIINYIQRGGNLLWFSDPQSSQHLETINELLEFEFLPGMVVDPTTQLFGINDPRFAIVSNYTQHPITQNFTSISLFPQAVAIDFNQQSEWNPQPFLQTVDRSWSETDEIISDVVFDSGRDLAGPLTIGIVMSRYPGDPDEDESTDNEDKPEQNQEQRHEQRIVVIGDGDFLSNSYLGNGGNLDLGLSILNWLSHDDDFIALPSKTAEDLHLELSATAQIMIGFGFLVLLPAGLIITGMLVWFKRRKQ